jgi:hypothetical protein
VLDFANVYPSILNWLLVTIMALTGILFLKYILARFNVPYVSDMVAAV